MLIRIKATGQVEDFIPSVAQNLLASGRGERVVPTAEEAPLEKRVEAAVVSAAENGMLMSAINFIRGPVTPRRARVG